MFSQSIGVPPLRAAYEAIVAKHNIDAILLVDGGTDSLMFGNEGGLGTPTEDMTSIAAVRSVSGVKKKILFNLGFGVDCHHGVCHSRYLENVGTIAKAGGFLGTFSLLNSHEESQKFQAVYEACDPVNSIVCSSILSAVQGEFGNVHSKHTRDRTAGSHLYISAIMSMYWAFDLETVARHILYLDKLTNAQSRSEVQAIINEFRRRFYESGIKFSGPRPDQRIPY